MDEFLTILSVFAFISTTILTLVIVLASLGKTLGIRKLYISLLLHIFEVNLRSFFRIKIVTGDTAKIYDIHSGSG